VVTQTYPSGHTVNFTYDIAGRINNDAGNLGDGVTRTYATALTYSQFGGLQQEQFGTQTALYHKLHYNVRGQLNDIRLSNVPWLSDEWNWNRGAVVNYYATADLSCPTPECRANSGPDNNGNIRQSQYWIPGNDQMSAYNWTEDRYDYDYLNRLKSVAEYHGSSAAALSGPDFTQVNTYDRWGNRTINQALTSPSIPHPNYTADLNTNRLVAPVGYSYSYDNAGNQTNDNYTGMGARTYDAENRLIQAQGIPNSQWQYYTYDADGRRIKRNVNGVETWQVYGMEGELLAEYRAGAAAFLPSREYGYRGGELLVTMTSGDDGRLARFVTNLYYGALQRDPSPSELQDKVNQLAAAGASSQAQLLTVASQITRALFTGTNYETNAPARTNAQYVGDLYSAYLQRGPDDGGLGWWTGQVATNGRANVCNAFEGSAEFITLVSTLYGTAVSDNERTEHFVNNLYLGSRGTNASPTELQTQRDALNAAAALGFSQVQTQAETMARALFVSQINDTSLGNAQYVTNLYETFLQRGPDAGGLGFWSPQASVGQGRQNVMDQFATCGPFRELAGTLYREANWLVTDHLGTARMIANKSGALPSIKRHDYLPFGEELSAGTSGRTLAQGYAGDSIRQKFTRKERDSETELDYFLARFYSSKQGRFTSPDSTEGNPATLYNGFALFSALPYASLLNPQSINLYAYVSNSPVTFFDLDGHKKKHGHARIPLVDSAGKKTNYTMRVEGGTNDSYNIHVFDKKGKEVGRFSAKPKDVGFKNAEKLPAEMQELVTRYAEAKWGTEAVTNGVPGSAYAEKFYARTAPKVFTGFLIAQIAVEVTGQIVESHNYGYYTDFFGNLIITNLPLAMANLPRGSQIQVEGIVFINTGRAWISADPNCPFCKLEVDNKGVYRIKGNRCCD
jgi:RHS repeat-associated protein